MKRWMAFLLTAVLLCGLASCTQEPPSVTGSATGAVILETPVGDLEYPSEYAASTRLESKEEDGLYSYTLYGATGSHEALLFTVYVGERGEGRLFGFAPDSQGTQRRSTFRSGNSRATIPGRRRSWSWCGRCSSTSMT